MFTTLFFKSNYNFIFIELLIKIRPKSQFKIDNVLILIRGLNPYFIGPLHESYSKLWFGPWLEPNLEV